MMKKSFFSAIVAMLALVACTKEFGSEIKPSGSTDAHSLSVEIESGSYLPEDGGTKATAEAIVRVNWEAGDEVSVVNVTRGTLLGGCLSYQKITYGEEYFAFAGTVEGQVEQGDKLLYIYPRIKCISDEGTECYNDSEKSLNSGEVKLEIDLSKQQYDANKSNSVPFYGYAEDHFSYSPQSSTINITKRIQFNLVTSYVHLNMSNIPATGADLTSIDLSNVNSGFRWVINSNEVSFEPCFENQGISVACSNAKVTKAGNAVIHFAVPASAQTGEDRVLTINKAYYNASYTKAERKVSKYYNQLYSTWESNVKVEDKGTETQVTIENGGSTGSAEGILPAEDAFKLDKPANIEVGGIGKITFDQTASSKILDNANAAGSTSIFFKVEDVTETKPVENANIVYEVTMKTLDENGTEVFSEEKAAGVATVIVPMGDDVLSVQSVKLVNESGQEIAGGVVDGSIKFENHTLEFKVNHFSKYAINYTIQEIDAVAKIGDRKFSSLASAVAAVQNGQTITLVRDCVGDGVVVDGKKFTLDFAGKTYTIDGSTVGSQGTQTSGMQLLKGSTLKFVNGTIVSTKAKLLIQNYADLTLEDMSLDLSGATATSMNYVISNNCGNIQILGTTSLKSRANDGVAFDLYYWPDGGYSEGVNVVVNTTGTITGKIEIDHDNTVSDADAAEKTSLKIQNGTFAAFEMTAYTGANVEVSGGLFSTDPWKYCAKGYATLSEPGSDGMYKVIAAPKADVIRVHPNPDMTQAIPESIINTLGENLFYQSTQTADGIPVPSVDGNGRMKLAENYNNVYDVSSGLNLNPIGTLDALDACYIFAAKENDGTNGEFENWNADFVVSLDRDVNANDLGLWGYYASWGVAVAFPSPVEIPAGTEVELLGYMTNNGGHSNWPYSDIKSIVKVFPCGAFKLNDNMNGATLTVDLRIFDPNNHDKYFVVESYSYTFGNNGNAAIIKGVAKIGTTGYDTLAEAIAAANAGDVVEILKADTYNVPGISKNITIQGNVEGVVFNCEGSGNIASIPNGATFKNVTMNFGQSGNYHGFQHAGHITMDGCTLNGLFFSYGDMTFNECKFNQTDEEYNMWTYAGDVTYIKCTFNSKGKFINVYNEGATEHYNVVAENCVFNTTKANKPALNIKETCGTTFLKYNVTINNCSCNDLQNTVNMVSTGTKYVGSPIWQVDDIKDGDACITVTVDGQKKFPATN